MAKDEQKLGIIGCCLYIAVLAFAVTFLSIGGVYLHDCPLEPLIPVFLIVYGCTMTFLVIAEVVFLMCGVYNSGPVIGLRALVLLFCSAWMIAGCVWVFRTDRRPPADAPEWKTCDPVVYDAAFALVIMGLISVCLSCLSKLCSCLCSSK